jgi:hypothetical protein
MGVAGPQVSQAVVDALSERRISYHPDRTVMDDVVLVVYPNRTGGKAHRFPPAPLFAESGKAHRTVRRIRGWMVSGMVGHALAPRAVVGAWRWAGPAGVSLLALPGVPAASALHRVARGIPRPSHPPAWPLALSGRRLRGAYAPF